MRVSLGVAPGVGEGEGLGMDFPIEDDTGGQLELLLASRHWQNPLFAGCLGGGVFVAGNSGKEADSNDEFDLAAFGVMGQGGVAYKIGDMVLELQPYLGVGGANVEITGFADGGGTYFLYGFKGGAFVALGSSVELGLEVGYQGFSSEVELDFGGVTTDLTLSGEGLRASGVLSVKF